jgi:hypothetical protein
MDLDKENPQYLLQMNFKQCRNISWESLFFILNIGMSHSEPSFAGNSVVND